MACAQSSNYEVKISTDKLSNILKEDEKKRKKLAEIYYDVRLLLAEKPDATLDSEISVRYKNYKMQLEIFPKDLTDDERPIVVAGETSAGKSTVLNLLIGFNVFPTSMLPCTGVVCRLRTSKTKKANIIDFNEKIVHTIEMKGNNEKKFSEELKSYIRLKGQRDEHQIKYVDIYWPVPFLTPWKMIVCSSHELPHTYSVCHLLKKGVTKKNIIVVDTPGIGHTEDMTDRLVQYLPNAVGLIYVIDPSHGGGIADDRIVPLFKAMQGQDINGMRQAFDPSCTIFICNKWDLVDEDEEDDIYRYVKNRLETHWPNMQEKQIVRFSAKEILKEMSPRHTLPQEFLKFRRGIEELIEVSLFAKSRQHMLWLDKFLTTIHISLTAHLNNITSSESQKKRQANRVNELLKTLQECKDTSEDKLKQEATDLCKKLAKAMFKHIRAQNTRERLFTWDCETLKLLDYGDYHKIRSEANKIFEKLVNNECTIFLRGSGVKKDVRSLLDKVREKEKFINETRKELEKVLQNQKEIDYVKPPNFDDKMILKFCASDTEVAAIAFTTPLWAPFFFVGAIIGLPAKVAFEKIENMLQVKEYKKDKKKFLTTWANEYLDAIKIDDVYRHVKSTMFEKFYQELNDVFVEDIPQIISGSEMLLKNLQTETGSAISIPESYKPKLEKCSQILERLNALSSMAT